MKRVIHLHDAKTSIPLCGRGGTYPRWTTNIMDITCKSCKGKLFKALVTGKAIIYEDRSGSISDSEIESFLSELKKINPDNAEIKE